MQRTTIDFDVMNNRQCLVNAGWQRAPKLDVTASLRELTEAKAGEDPQEILAGKLPQLGHQATA